MEIKPPKLTKFKKVITLSDIQYPTHINLKPVIDFIKDEKPDEIIYIGDITNADGIGAYWEGDEEEGVYETVKEIEGFVRDVHSKVRAAAPNAKIILTGGNHLEARVRKAIKKKEFRRDQLEIKKYMPDVKIYEYGKVYKVGKLHYTHGWYFNTAHAKKHVDTFGKNLVYGHVHDVSEATKLSIIGEKPIMAKSIGCLCNRNPEYRKNMPNNWVHAFHIAYIRPDGDFYEYTIKIINGKFFFNNKLYE